MEVVKNFKYLSNLLEESLSFCDHVDYVFKRALQRLFLLRKLKGFDVRQHIIQLVHMGLIESFIYVSIITWYDNNSDNNKIKLAHVDIKTHIVRSYPSSE